STSEPFAVRLTIAAAGSPQDAPSTVTETDLPTPTSKPEAADSIQACAPLPQVAAARAFRRPPVVLSPANEAFWSTVRRIRALRPTPLVEGNAAFASAATPVTCGAAMEVPSEKR